MTAMDETDQPRRIRVPVVHNSPHPLPTYGTPGSAGMDLRAHLAAPVDLAPGARTLVPTGLRLQLPQGYEAQVRPRSGLALKRGITVLNTPGTIDADYRGEIGIILINLSAETQRIKPGDRLAQLVFAPVLQAELVPVEAIHVSARGTDGFGSTGTS